MPIYTTGLELLGPNRYTVFAIPRLPLFMDCLRDPQYQPFVVEYHIALRLHRHFRLNELKIKDPKKLATCQ
jgi:hypothetical protein